MRKVTENGFTVALDSMGRPVTFITADGRRELMMLGVTEWGRDDVKEVVKGEFHKTTKKIGAQFCVWMPNAKGHNRGLMIYGDAYIKAQQDPECDERKRLSAVEKEYGIEIPMTVCCD